MFSLDALFAVLDKLAPMELDRKMIAAGEYDNSGIILRTGEKADKIVFSLDLSDAAVRYAESVGANAIATHHPAIYNPILSLDYRGDNSSLALAATAGISVISMHLNLDAADGGIDQSLAEGLGGEEIKLIDHLDDTHGYGREFAVGENVDVFVDRIKKNLDTDNVWVFGIKDGRCERAASFCGGGASHCLDYCKKGKVNADTVITSDMPHHIIKELADKGKRIILIPHYVSESYGFKKFYERATAIIGTQAETYYFDDKSLR